MMTSYNPDPGPVTLWPMMRRQLLWWMVAVTAGGTAATELGCKFDRPAALVDAEPGAPDAVDLDAEPPDAELGCTPDMIVCDDTIGRYTECSSAGVVTLAIECPLGCAAEVEQCLDVAPSNGVAGYLDQARTDEAVVDVTFSGSSTINTDTGEVMRAGVSLDVPSAVANGMRILMVKNLQIPGTLKVSGSLPLAIVADGDVSVTGVLDVSADGVVAGPGAVQTGDCFGANSVGLSGNAVPGGGGAGRALAGARGGYATGVPRLALQVRPCPILT